ncbi:MAG: hypothetical protein HYR51_07940 [Candidatus Rokubacteria bacterium]|nr:hypothetical protein [Candidatus Rokubacteria bacterium]
MLFNSNEFVFVFLPVALVGFFLVQRLGGPRAGVVWLALGSVVFYTYWRLENVLVFAASIGGDLMKHRDRIAAKRASLTPDVRWTGRREPVKSLDGR